MDAGPDPPADSAAHHRGRDRRVLRRAGKWQQVWQGSSAALAYTAALEAPREMTLKYRFPPGSARMVRMRQTLSDPTFYWSIAELRVLRP